MLSVGRSKGLVNGNFFLNTTKELIKYVCVFCNMGNYFITMHAAKAFGNSKSIVSCEMLC